jgi:hypothetical protein
MQLVPAAFAQSRATTSLLFFAFISMISSIKRCESFSPVKLHSSGRTMSEYDVLEKSIAANAEEEVEAEELQLAVSFFFPFSS